MPELEEYLLTLFTKEELDLILVQMLRNRSGARVVEGACLESK